MLGLGAWGNLITLSTAADGTMDIRSLKSCMRDRHAAMDPWCAAPARPRRLGFSRPPHSPGRLPGHRCQQHFACGLRFAFLPRGGCVAPLQLPAGVFAIPGARAHAHLTANLSLSPWSCPCALRAASFASNLRTGAVLSFPPPAQPTARVCHAQAGGGWRALCVRPGGWGRLEAAARVRAPERAFWVS